MKTLISSAPRRQCPMEHQKGDVLNQLHGFDDNTFDGLMTDPPYGLGFMEHEWDAGVPTVDVWKETLRVCKPGAFLLAFGGTRTFHRLASNIEDAGWEIRDCLMWLYGQGFPKSHNISKAIDKDLGGERKVVGERRQRGRKRPDGRNVGMAHSTSAVPYHRPGRRTRRGRWDGYGTALKPGWEPIIFAMKPRDGGFFQKRPGMGLRRSEHRRLSNRHDGRHRAKSSGPVCQDSQWQRRPKPVGSVWAQHHPDSQWSLARQRRPR